jgi:phosphoribosylaminoimidazole (AIR) synthetase
LLTFDFLVFLRYYKVSFSYPMSESYKKSGVDIAAGDAASALAARAARSTFAGRNGKMGQPVDLPGGFAGVLDFGGFLFGSVL